MSSFLYAFVRFVNLFSTICFADESPPTTAPRSTTYNKSGSSSTTYSNETFIPCVATSIPSSAAGTPNTSWIIPKRELGPYALILSSFARMINAFLSASFTVSCTDAIVSSKPAKPLLHQLLFQRFHQAHQHFHGMNPCILSCLLLIESYQ